MKNTNQKLAITLDNAAKNATAIAQISNSQIITLDDAYVIQTLAIAQRYERGEKLVGLKLGFTSVAKMEQMGVHDMIWGRLTNDMQFENGDDLRKSKFIHPRAEPEIAFLIKDDITENLTLETAPNFIEAVAGAIEIIDSRYENFKFSLEDVVADNCSSAGFVIGNWLTPNTNLSDLKIELKIDGKTIETGSSDAILGNPWESVVAAARLSLQYNEPIKKGMVLLAGAATSAVFIQVGQIVEAEIETLGNIRLNVK